MAQVTYRGVAYDTAEHRNRSVSSKKVQEVYRGIKHDETIKVVEASK